MPEAWGGELMVDESMRPVVTGGPDAIAVVGMACRLPGAADPGALWRLLREGVDAVTEAPEGRWPEAADYRRGGFLSDVDGFDAAFFGISPNEAAAMDPQQRLVLELAWEALENARTAPTGLRGSVGGVFLGAISNDYAALLAGAGAEPGRHAYTGANRAMIANRVSYFLGLRGPSLTLDAGQSSSLVAVQLACESLRGGETALALAGGVNLNLSGATTDAIGSFGALSPDGRCHVFDSRANGYVRGEGGGLVVLKRLADAVADGRRRARRDPRRGGQQRRRRRRAHRAQPAGAGGGHPAGLRPRRRGPGRRRLRRAARHRHQGRRPGGGRGARRGVRLLPAGERAAAGRLGQDQHRASGRRRGHRRAAEGGARHQASRAARQPALRVAAAGDPAAGPAPARRPRDRSLAWW